MLGFIIKGFVYVWICIIAFMPNVFMAALTICIVATLITYLEKRKTG